MKNWKTTVAGILLGLGPLLSAYGSTSWQWHTGQLCMTLGAFLMGAVAKDNNVTGGTKIQ